MVFKNKLSRTLLTVGVSIVLAIVLSLLASSGISPVYGPYEGSNFTYDPALFKYEAMAILSGQKPYIDFYDHKGLWHIGINLLGVIINKDYGILVLEIISGSICIYFYLEAIKKVTDSIITRHIAIFFFIIIRFIVGTGGTIGIWLMPFSAAYLYFYVAALSKEDERYFYIGSVFLGLEASFALNSRPMDMVYVWGGAFFLLAYSIMNKKLPMLFKNIAVMLVSFIVPLLVFVLVAANNGFLSEMIDCLLLANFKYIGRNSGVPTDQIVSRIIAFIVLAFFVYFFFPTRSSWKENPLKMFFFFAGVFAFAPLLLVVRFFSHFIAGAPLIGVAIAGVSRCCKKELPTLKKIAFAVSAASAFILCLTPLAYYTFGLGDFHYEKNRQDTVALLSTIPEEDRVSGNIYAVDCSCQVYNLLGVVTDNKYYCNQTWWSYDNPTVMDDALQYVKDSKPKYVIIWKETLSEKWVETLLPYSLLSDEAARFFIYRLN